jgi:hypothetical protein
VLSGCEKLLLAALLLQFEAGAAVVGGRRCGRKVVWSVLLAAVEQLRRVGLVVAGDAALLNPVLWSRCQDRHVPVLLKSR